MELRHLRYFIVAAEEEHFGRASDRLHVTRPAVSQMIADLEAELGTPLFDRLAHRVRLTAAGNALLPKLHAVMSELNDALSLAKRVGEGKSGNLSIGYGSLTLMHGLFREAIKRFHETYPDVTLSLYEMSSSDQPKALAEGRIQAGFMHFGPHALEKHRPTHGSPQNHVLLDWYSIQEGGLGAVVPHGHRLSGRSAIDLHELAGERFVVVPRSSSSPGYGPLYAMCQKAGFQPHIVQEVSTVASQLNLVSVGMGIGLAVTGKHFTYPNGLSVVPLNDLDISTTFVFGWVKDYTDPAMDRMIEIVKDLSRDL